MKLYATTTSERASKGQGGNEYLRVSLTVGNAKEQANAGVIEVIESSPNKFAIKYHLNGKTKLLQEVNTNGTIFETKGKSQKGEKKCNDVTCINCDNTMEGLCDNCRT